MYVTDTKKFYNLFFTKLQILSTDFVLIFATVQCLSNTRGDIHFHSLSRSIANDMLLNIKHGKSISSVAVTLDENVHDLKNKVEEATQIARDRQKLIYRGRSIRLIAVDRIHSNVYAAAEL
jgi:hypothetical protein